MSATRDASIAVWNGELRFALLDGWQVSIELIGPWNGGSTIGGHYPSDSVDGQCCDF
jgi:hypothetical protein